MRTGTARSFLLKCYHQENTAMKNQYERMEAGLIYDPADEEIHKEQDKYLDRMYEFNHSRPSEKEKRISFMKEVFAECGDNCWIEPPFISAMDVSSMLYVRGQYDASTGYPEA